jgi:beta-lactam-binding protein with PASTA domain
VSLLKDSSCGSVVKGKVIEKGHVCHQSPAAGQKSSTKLSVGIRVQHENPWRGDLANGRFWFLMPDMTGWQVDKARAKLKELGYQGELSVFTDPKCKAGVVCKQSPRALERADNTSGKSITVGQQ